MNLYGWSNRAITHELPLMDEHDRAVALFELKLREGQGMYERGGLQEALPGLSKREILEGMKPAELQDYKSFLLDKYSDIENEVNLVNEVLDGYGVSYGEDNIILGEN